MTPPIPPTLRGDPEAIEAFLRERWVLSATMALEDARHAAGLSPEALAARIGTTPAAVRRAERDDSGAITLRQILDWMVACGVMLEEIRTYSLDK